MEITKEQFSAYVRVQKSGVTNMFDVRTVCLLSGLDRTEAIQIMGEYSALQSKFS